MGKRHFLLSIFALPALFAGAVVAEETVYMLQSNPFARPLVEKPTEAKPILAPEPSSLKDLELRATMVTKGDSFANVGGMILGIGEEIQGYRLVSVENEKAVFSKAGEFITLTLDSESGHEE